MTGVYYFGRKEKFISQNILAINPVNLKICRQRRERGIDKISKKKAHAGKTYYCREENTSKIFEKLL